jgi:hypothetical protein
MGLPRSTFYDVPAARVSSTIRRFSSAVHRRRRGGSLTPSHLDLGVHQSDLWTPSPQEVSLYAVLAGFEQALEIGRLRWRSSQGLSWPLGDARDRTYRPSAARSGSCSRARHRPRQGTAPRHRARHPQLRSHSILWDIDPHECVAIPRPWLVLL